ncbi:MAG: hypothetical protein ACU0CA_15580 [Paracoccaceae bacterium]
MNKAGKIDVFGLLAAILLLVYSLSKHRRFFHDDAFISLRYARNLAEHGQLTWNLGEYAEGYTNFLYVLMTALPIKLGFDPAYSAQAINVAAAIFLIYLQFRACRILLPTDGQAYLRAAVVIATGATPAIAIWVLGGLESIVVAMFVAAAILALLPSVISRPTPASLSLAALAFTLAVLTRLDIAVFIAGTGLGLLAATKSPLRQRLTPALVVVGIPAVASLIHMAWRWSYYGELLPLTFYAKTGVPLPVRLNYLPTFFADSFPAAAIIAVAMTYALYLLATHRTTPQFWLLFSPVVAQILYVVWSGGDHMPGARVLVPLIVPAGLILLTGKSQQDAKKTTPVILLALAGVVVTALLVPPTKTDPAAYYGRFIGLHISKSWSPESTVALHTAGSTPFFASQMTFVDMLGLNDPTIAKRRNVPILTFMQSLPGHAKGDAQYVLDRQPDYIIAGPANGTNVNTPWFLSDAELFRSAEFHRCYDLHSETFEINEVPLWRGTVPYKPLIFRYYQRNC